jgi:hypothetical protein
MFTNPVDEVDYSHPGKPRIRTEEMCQCHAQIFIEQNLPELETFTRLHFIRGNPFIITEEKKEEVTEDKPMKEDFVPFIQKPMDKDELSGMMKKMFEPTAKKADRQKFDKVMECVDNPPQPSRHPKKYFSKKKTIIRLREIGGDEIIQHEGLIYRLDKNDPSALALYGGHQIIVLNQELVDFEKWMIVSVTELW